MLEARGLNHIDLGTRDMEAAHAEGATPQVRFRRDGRVKTHPKDATSARAS